MERTQNIAHAAPDEDVPGWARSSPEDVDDAAATGLRGADGARPSRLRSSSLAPPAPESLEDAGLSEEFVAGLVLKALHVRGAVPGFGLADMLALPMALLDDVVRRLQERRFVEVHATTGPNRGEYVFKLTGAGRKRAREELEVSRYVGPAPVPFEDFRRWVDLQAIGQARVAEEDLRGALEGIVVPEPMLELLGPAVSSGRSLFLYGAPGNGKSLVAERIARVFGQRYYVPYSVLVDGSVMIVYDPVHHRLDARDPDAFGEDLGAPADPLAAWVAEAGPELADDPTERAASTVAHETGDLRREILRSIPEHDRRYAEAQRPLVVAGGELTLEQLDLQWDAAGRMYQAPPQLKAAGGVLVVDDLGRQRVPVRELLNRWVVPLEHRHDYLTLRSGRKIVVPFDCFVIFSTNLEPAALADEAFLRRIHYKIEVPGPSPDEYERIFRHCCEERGIAFDRSAVEYLLGEVYGKGAIEPRRCHPRDVLDHLCDLAAYRGQEARLSPDLLERACQSYFLPSGAGRGRADADPPPPPGGHATPPGFLTES